MTVTGIQVVAGGTPTDEELAAMTVAFDVLAAEATSREPSATLAGWQQAALREGVGGPMNVVPPPPDPTRD